MEKMWLFEGERDVVMLRVGTMIMAIIGGIGASWGLFQILSGNA